jgi:hypothetical protein
MKDGVQLDVAVYPYSQYLAMKFYHSNYFMSETFTEVNVGALVVDRLLSDRGILMYVTKEANSSDGNIRFWIQPPHHVGFTFLTRSLVDPSGKQLDMKVLSANSFEKAFLPLKDLFRNEVSSSKGLGEVIVPGIPQEIYEFLQKQAKVGSRLRKLLGETTRMDFFMHGAIKLQISDEMNEGSTRETRDSFLSYLSHLKQAKLPMSKYELEALQNSRLRARMERSFEEHDIACLWTAAETAVTFLAHEDDHSAVVNGF